MVGPTISNYQVDHLFLLIGTNPLPNYVSARLLARDPQRTTIWFVHSKDTAKERDTLQKSLQTKGFQLFQSIQVDEASPMDIYNQIQQRARSLHRVIGLNYTGGTKAMAVHAYRALQDLNVQVQYSYLDARHLRMQVGLSGRSEMITDVIDRVHVSLEQLLALHDLSDLRQPMRREVMWEPVINTLADLHTSAHGLDKWRTWCTTNLRRPERPEKFANPTRIKAISTESLPEQLQQTLRAMFPDLTFPTTFEQLAARSPLRKADEDFAKWFDGIWLEQYVYLQLQPLLGTIIQDLAMTINPDIPGGADFEFDIACMRGYQLFACSVTSSSKDGECKSKLLEGLIRSEQIGGSEARVALICCTDDPAKIHNQLSNPTHRMRSRVFGREHLHDLKTHLHNWITT